MRRVPLIALVVSGVALSLATCAGADVFEPIRLGSVSTAAPAEQANFARDPAISQDGDYVAFDGAFNGETGVWRRDIATGVVEEVAGGDARLPSISEEGRYISFTTTEKLVPEDTNSGPDVYVRDMELPAVAPGAYILASAITVEGETQDLAYEYAAGAGTEKRKREEHGSGALASGRSALSANGKKVAFVTTLPSDLAGPHTPALQVAVRNLETGETQLVSALANPATGAPELNAEGQDMPVPTVVEPGGAEIGAIYPDKNKTEFAAVTAATNGFGPIWVGASISADGSAVAWMGQQIGRQTKVLANDPAKAQSEYTEPLWREIDGGPTVPVRRVTGGSDPVSPTCEASGETGLSVPGTLGDPCQGPFEPRPSAGGESGIWTGGSETADYQPHLSANGKIVAFVSNARYIATGTEFGALEHSDDLYLDNMGSGLTRVLALSRLTEVTGGSLTETARAAPIEDVGISPDGTQVAFSTKRTIFPLSSPAYISAPAAIAGMSELYDVDLADDTLTRVTHGFGGEGEPAEEPHPEVAAGRDPYEEEQEGSFSPSFSSNGNVLAFSSSADNLVFGDGNRAPDVFVVDRKVFTSEPSEQLISSPPPGPLLSPEWRLGISAISHSNGSVTIYAEVPGAGQLRASAQGTVLVSAPVRRGSRKRALHAAPATVATGTHASTGVGGLESLTLKLSPRYSEMADRKAGLSATVTALFSSSGHPTLRQSIVVTFRRTVKPKAAKSKAAKRGGKSARKGAHRR
jgi:WD40-like Beta Propeller Repeat